MTHYLWDSALEWLRDVDPREARFCDQYGIDSDQIQDQHQDAMADSGFFIDFDDLASVVDNWSKIKQILEEGEAPISEHEVFETIVDAIHSDVARELLVSKHELTDYVWDMDFSDLDSPSKSEVVDFIVEQIRELAGDELDVDKDEEEE